MNELTVLLTEAQLDDLADRIAARVQVNKPDPPSSSLLSAKDVCDRLAIGRTTLYNLRKKGEIEAVTVGGSIRFRRADVEALQK